MHTGTGIITYDPPRGDMKKRTAWWCVVNVDREITRYYRWWLDKELINPLGFADQGLFQPAWDAHISVVRGEKPTPEKMHLWKKFNGQRVTYKYDHVGQFYIGKNRKGEAPGKFFIVEIDCPELLAIRQDLGFKSDWKLHLTFGRTYE